MLISVNHLFAPRPQKMANIEPLSCPFYNQIPVIWGATCPHNSKLLFEQVFAVEETITAFRKHLRGAKDAVFWTKPIGLLPAWKATWAFGRYLKKTMFVVLTCQAISANIPMQGDLQTVFTYSQVAKVQNSLQICLLRKLQCLREVRFCSIILWEDPSEKLGWCAIDVVDMY